MKNILLCYNSKVNGRYEFKKFKNFKGPAILNVEISKFQPVAELHEIKSKKKKLII